MHVFLSFSASIYVSRRRMAAFSAKSEILDCVSLLFDGDLVWYLLAFTLVLVWWLLLFLLALVWCFCPELYWPLVIGMLV